MPRFFIYGKKRRKVPDVLDVHLLVVAPVRAVEIKKRVVNVIPIAIKSMPALFGAGIL